MAKLVYITNTSLDGYIEDETGSFDWGHAHQVHEFITDLVRPMGTWLYGRRLYESMTYWDAPVDSYPPAQQAFARVWHDTDKVVFSRTLTAATTRRTRLERDFEPEAIRRLKQESPHDIGIGGAALAGCAFDAALVDECHLFMYPVIVGSGKPAFRPGPRRNLELVETRRFDSGVVQMRYRVSR